MFADDRLWAVTAYFNPGGFRNRLRNFRRFRDRFGVPLVLVELGFEGEFELSSADAEIYVRVENGDRMWQKERLLNLGLAQLPDRCPFVALVDGDVEFESPRWVEDAIRELDSRPIVQLYDSVCHESESPDRALFLEPAMAGHPLSEVFAPGVRRGRGNSFAIGFAWAARRDLLQRHGLYDRCIVGGGDSAFVCAVGGFPQGVIGWHGMNALQTRCYLDWASPISEEVAGRLGGIPGRIRHFWHGSIEDRKPLDRHQILLEHGFDPYADIAVGESGAWQWNTNKPALHNAVKRYFESRHEDGVAVSA